MATVVGRQLSLDDFADKLVIVKRGDGRVELYKLETE